MIVDLQFLWPFQQCFSNIWLADHSNIHVVVCFGYFNASMVKNVIKIDLYFKQVVESNFSFDVKSEKVLQFSAEHCKTW